ncbi:MAG: insulinase family protein [Opitutus sp.]|nr:insulinase family protein [Opitutus sp.]
MTPLSSPVTFTLSQRVVRRAALVCLLAVLFPSARAAEAMPPKKVATVEGITEYQFNNGLRLLLFPDQSQSKVSVNLTVLVGSRHEGLGETGMAHLLEHMVFKGTPRHPLVPKALQEHGAIYNGSTSSDRTNYFETLAATDENLEFAIDLEADRLMNSLIRREDLLSEMTVVRNEFERGENSPAGVLRQRIASAAYDWHNYGKSTIGNRSDIERVPVENLREFYRKFYQPDNIVVIVAGKFDEAKALGFVQKHFGGIPRPARQLAAAWTEEPAQDGERSVTLRRVGSVSSVGVAYHIPAGSHEEAAAVQVLAGVLSARPSGRLFKELVETKRATSAVAFARGEHDPGLFMASAEVARDGSVEDVRDRLIATLEGAGATNLTAEEVNRAKQQILKARERNATDTAQIGISLSEWAAQGDWRLYFLHRDRVEQVTPESVKAAAVHYLRQSNRTVGVFIPTDQPERAPVPATPDLNAAVANYRGRAALAEGEAFEATPANIEARVQRSELPEGIKVTLLPKKSRGQEVHLTLTLHYGNEDNLNNLTAAAAFLPELMLEGTKKLSHQQLRDELDRLGATLSAGAGGGGGRRGGRRGGGGGAAAAPGAISFSIQAKRDTLPAVLDLLRQVLREPLLPADQFDLLKRARLANLEQTRTEPDALGPRLLQRQLNPHPKDDIRYLPTIDESIARLQIASYAQLTQIYRDYVGSRAGEVTIVGDFDPAACLPILKDALSGWTDKKPYARIANPLTGTVAGSHHVISTPDKANATYSAGLNLAMRDDDPDYSALLIGNYILGSGALASRLGVRIRQQEGLSYGVSSSFTASSWEPRATFAITAICNPQNMARLEVCVQEELQRLLRDGVTADELAKARQGYLESQKVSRTSDTAIAASLATQRQLGRTMSWQADAERKINALTPDSVNAALRKHLDPSKLVIVAAGDFAAKPAAGGK